MWIVFLGAVGYGIYEGYGAWFSKERVTTLVEEGKKRVEEVAVETGKKYADRAVEHVASSTEGYLKKKASDALVGIGESIVNAARSLVGASTSSVDRPLQESGTVPAQTGLGFSVPPPSATVTVRTRDPFVVSLNRAGTYTVEWGDGQHDRGVVAPDTSTFVSHAWERPGDFTVTSTVRGTTGASVIVFPVRVHE